MQQKFPQLSIEEMRVILQSVGMIGPYGELSDEEIGLLWNFALDPQIPERHLTNKLRALLGIDETRTYQTSIFQVQLIDDGKEIWERLQKGEPLLYDAPDWRSTLSGTEEGRALLAKFGELTTATDYRWDIRERAISVSLSLFGSCLVPDLYGGFEENREECTPLFWFNREVGPRDSNRQSLRARILKPILKSMV